MRGVFKRSLAAGAALFAGVTSAEGAVILHEPFNYAGATLGGQSAAATGLTGSWTDNATPPNGTGPGGFAGTTPSGAVALSNDSTSLSFPNVPASGARVSDTDGGYAMRSTSTSPVDLTTSNTYYISALIRGSGAVQFDNASFSIVSFGIRNSQFVLNIRDQGNTNPTNVYAGGTYDANTTYLFVAKVVGGSTDTIGLNIYDAAMAIPASDPGTFERNASVGSSQAANRLAITSFNGASNFVDEVRVGTTWADVVPEPSAVGALAAGGLGLLARRRRAGTDHRDAGH